MRVAQRSGASCVASRGRMLRPQSAGSNQRNGTLMDALDDGASISTWMQSGGQQRPAPLLQVAPQERLQRLRLLSAIHLRQTAPGQGPGPHRSLSAQRRPGPLCAALCSGIRIGNAIEHIGGALHYRLCPKTQVGLLSALSAATQEPSLSGQVDSDLCSPGRLDSLGSGSSIPPGQRLVTLVGRSHGYTAPWRSMDASRVQRQAPPSALLWGLEPGAAAKQTYSMSN